MYIIIFIIISIIIYVGWHAYKYLDEKIHAIETQHSALFRAVQEEDLIDVRIYNEALKIARGEKSPQGRLKKKQSC